MQTKHNFRQLYLALVIFLLPWQARLILGPPSELAISEYIIASIFAIDMLMLIAVFWCRPRLEWVSANKLSSPLLVIAYLIIVSFFIADPLSAFWKLAQLILLFYFILAFRQNANARLMNNALIFSAVLQSLFGLWQVLRLYVPASTILGMSEQTALRLGASVVETASGRWLRAYGTFPHPNILGGFLAIALLFVVDRYFTAYENFQQWWNKYGIATKNLWRETTVRQTAREIALTLTAFIVVFAGLIATFSRSAFIALVIGSLIYWAMKYRANRIRAMVLGVKLVAVAVAVLFVWQLFLPELWQVRVASNTRLEQQSVSERVQGYYDAWQVFKKYPLFGTGLQNYTLALAKLNPGRPSFTYQPVHNSFLLLFIELGIVGTAVVLFIFRKRLKEFFYYFYTQASPLTVAMLALLIVIGLLDHYLWSLHSGLLMAGAVIALTIRFSRLV